MSRRTKGSKASSGSKKSKDALDRLLPIQISENEIIRELRQTVEKLKVFDSLGKAITSSLDLKDVLKIMVERIGSLVNSKNVALLLSDSETSDAYFEHPPELKEKRLSFPLGQGILGRCMERGKGGVFIYKSNEASFDPVIDSACVQNPTSMMTLPIMSRGVVLGLLAFFTEKDEPVFTDESFRLIETFSDYLSIAVENARNYQRVRELTVTDDLTKLYNSRYLHLVLERELARSERYNENFSIVFIDLDNFKMINDQNGHMAGSLLLKEFGDYLVQIVRTSDIAIRYGGDEFVLVLPRTSKAEAIQFVTRARDQLRERLFLKARQLQIKCTASFGISTFPEDGHSIDQLISAADKAMYIVKKGAKDGVHAYTRPATLIKGERSSS